MHAIRRHWLIGADGLPWFIFVGHSLKLPITVALTTSRLASLEQPRNLSIRRVKTTFLTVEMFAFPLRQLPWKCVAESTLRSFGPGLGEDHPSKVLHESIPGKPFPKSDHLPWRTLRSPQPVTLIGISGAFPVLTPRKQIHLQVKNFCSYWHGTEG